MSYPVVWRHPPGPPTAGSLRLGPRSLTLDGVASGGVPGVCEVGYSELVRVRMATGGEERLGGRPTLLLEPRSGGRLEIAAVTGPGVLGEIADLLADAMASAEPEPAR